jgi:uncharacterized membrane protein YphA (DoxX/SURF4 family)
MLRALLLAALAAPSSALFAGKAAPKPVVAGHVSRSVAPKMIFAGKAAPKEVFDEPEQPEFITTVSDLGITALRLGTCALMVHHGFDKIQNVEGFSANVVAKFFGFLPGPPQFWTLSAAATQIAGAGLLSIGVFSRPVALSMSATMITAVIFHLLNTGGEAFPLGVPKAHSYNFELAAMYVFVLGYFSVSGAGKYSVDELVLGGELNFYSGLLDKVFGGEEE